MEVERWRAAMLEVLEARFGPGVAPELTEPLNAVIEKDKLSELVQQAFEARSVSEFCRTLTSTTD